MQLHPTSDASLIRTPPQLDSAPCRMHDVGKPKAEVAAQRIQQRIAGITVTPHFGRIEEKPIEFYEQFHIIILGLDSLEARRYMNQVACSFLGAPLTTGGAAQSAAGLQWP